jgi:hypothetical protein
MSFNNKPKDEKGRLGIPWLWELPESHKFTECAQYHDGAYDVGEGLYSIGEKELALRYIKRADKDFVICCLKVARKENSFFLKMQAIAFGHLVITWRKLKFKKKGDS